jgi:hypothetical protein
MNTMETYKNLPKKLNKHHRMVNRTNMSGNFLAKTIKTGIFGALCCLKCRTVSGFYQRKDGLCPFCGGEIR